MWFPLVAVPLAMSAPEESLVSKKECTAMLVTCLVNSFFNLLNPERWITFDVPGFVHRARYVYGGRS